MLGSSVDVYRGPPFSTAVTGTVAHDGHTGTNYRMTGLVEVGSSLETFVDSVDVIPDMSCTRSQTLPNPGKSLWTSNFLIPTLRVRGTRHTKVPLCGLHLCRREEGSDRRRPRVPVRSLEEE